jgi:hypothetical protein
MKKEQEKETKEKVDFALEVGKFLPETKQKVEYYKDIMKAEKGLIDALEKAIKSKDTSEIDKSRHSIEVIERKNSIIAKMKVFENYMFRKKKYEKFLDEMSREATEFFDSTLQEAKEITYNIRLMDSIARYEKHENPTMQERVEFYLYLKQEILNSEKHRSKKIKEHSKGKVVPMTPIAIEETKDSE